MINVLLISKRYTGNFPLLNEMARLDPERFRVVVCYLGGQADEGNGMEAIASRCYYLGYANRQTRMTNLSLVARLRRIIDDEDIHVVNCHLLRSTGPGLVAALLADNRPAVISTLHGLGSVSSFRRKVGNWLLYKKLFRIVGVSHAVRFDVLQTNWRLSTEKVVTIQNGLNLDRFLQGVSKEEARKRLLPTTGSGCWFGAVGRLSPVKNHQSLVQAFGRVAENNQDCRLLLVGRGELEASLREQVQALGLSDKVVFLGFRNDVPDILRALDVFVFPSLREGMPLSILEAMASGLPVVAASVGGIPEIFDGRAIGRLVEPGNVESLATAMTELANLPPEQRMTLGETGRKRAIDDFSAERMVRQYEELFTEAWTDWKRRRR